MPSYPNWSEREDELVRTLYATLGAKGTAEALRSEHFVRTEGAVKERAKHLKVKRDRSMMRRTMDNAWTEEELSIIRAVYPKQGADGVVRQLAARGYKRTKGAVNTRAAMLGIRMTDTKRRMTKGGDKVIVNLCMDTVLDAEVIERLNAQRNRSEYVRELVRKDIGQKS